LHPARVDHGGLRAQGGVPLERRGEQLVPTTIFLPATIIVPPVA
jgi:hypothetical protein